MNTTTKRTILAHLTKAKAWAEALVDPSPDEESAYKNLMATIHQYKELPTFNPTPKPLTHRTRYGRLSMR